MEKEELSLGGFSAILDTFVPKTPQETFKVDEQIDSPMDDDELEQIKKNRIEPALEGKISKQNTKVKEEDTEEDSEEDLDDETIDDKVKPVIKNKNDKADKNIDDNTLDTVDDNIDDGTDTNESSVVTGFFDAMSEKLGWEFDEEEEKPKTAEELIEYFQKVIEEESKPTYYSEEVEALDNFVKQGGNLKDYL